MDQATIRLTIRRKLDDGTLPHNSIPRFWGGPADGEFCDACEEVITAAQLLNPRSSCRYFGCFTLSHG